MLKKYIFNGKEWQYEEGEQPKGAIELKAAQPTKNKAAKPTNKARKAAVK